MISITQDSHMAKKIAKNKSVINSHYAVTIQSASAHRICELERASEIMLSIPSFDEGTEAQGDEVLGPRV